MHAVPNKQHEQNITETHFTEQEKAERLCWSHRSSILMLLLGSVWNGCISVVLGVLGWMKGENVLAQAVAASEGSATLRTAKAL